MKTTKFFLFFLVSFIASNNVYPQLDSVYYKGPSQGSVSGGEIQSTDNFSDELIIFGNKIPEFKKAHEELVVADPFMQRHPDFHDIVKRYIEDEESDPEIFLEAITAERRRLFISANQEKLEEAIGKQSLWVTTVFHYAGEYLKELACLNSSSQPILDNILKKLVLGLNRVWTGHLAEDDETLWL